MRIYALTLFVIAFALPFTAGAQSMSPGASNPLLDPGSDKRRIEDDRRMSEFRSIDTDESGGLSAEEITQRQTSLFSLMDRNRDGKLDFDEFRLRRLDLPPSGKSEQFQLLDSNNDAAISLDEYVNAADADRKAADIDNDGMLNLWEFRTRE